VHQVGFYYTDSCYSCQVFNGTRIFLTVFLKNTQIPNFMKIHPVRADLFYVAGHTGRDDKANSHFLQLLECD